MPDARSGRPATPAEAEREQLRLRELVRPGPARPVRPARVAGLDVAYAPDDSVLAAAVVVLDAVTLEVVDSAHALGRPAFGYVPGLFAFREVPTLLDALERLTAVPELLVCDGHGRAHPRRFGLACHLGVLTGLASIGVAKTAFVGTHAPPGPARGDRSPLVDAGETVGAVLRTRSGVKPVYVSTGHRVELDAAVDQVLALTPRYRLPETTRQADRLCRSVLRARLGG
ncbi:endonuclease V [Allonocardiopsis opalescens]|uniref:Endonuclease V n=1 Tax=Allonocardiopsis opalescens TaxID=1144618 RepID=A0A2T0QCM7_9ACTN|nr:endonuclease V [Allonocardiopsis opalescens]PRY01669.1 endonuclease V [Allonocardiopsis opalescens]